jgi:hypothetical protein
MRNGIAICGALAGLVISISMAQASEVWVRQASGQISGGTPVAEQNKAVKPAPEGTAAVAGSPTTPVTCNQQNASSPACYSATQQTRGK